MCSRSPTPLLGVGLLLLLALPCGCTEAGDPLFAAIDSGAVLGDGTSGGLVDYALQIAPIFEDRCLTCHGSSALGGLRLDSYQGLLAGGELGRVAIPCDPDGSLVYLKVALNPPPAGETMPLSGTPLSRTRVELIRRWIAEGAAERPQPGLCDAASASPLRP